MDDQQIAEQPAGRRWPMVVVVVAIAVVLGLIAWDQRPWDDSGATASDSGVGMLSDETPRRDGDAPDFALLDERGERVALSDFEGRVGVPQLLGDMVHLLQRGDARYAARAGCVWR